MATVDVLSCSFDLIFQTSELNLVVRVFEPCVIEYLYEYRVCFVVDLVPIYVGDYYRGLSQIEMMALQISSALGVGVCL